MTQLKTYEELQGRTLLRVKYFDERIFFIFTDNTFCVCHGVYERDCELMDENYNQVPDLYNAYELHAAGFITLEERDAVIEQKKKQQDEKQREYDIEQLKKLKEKYPEI